MPLRDLVIVEKSLTRPVGWLTPDPADGVTRFSVPLDIGGVTEAGLTLDGVARAHHPDESVTFELAFTDTRSGKRIRLMRVDWRSLQDGHSNSRRKCASTPWAGVRLPRTHFHSFEMNYVEAENRMRRGNNLPCAEPIDPPLESFEELRKFVGTTFKIKDIELVPPPAWVYDLFQ